jgi:RHS repeat-associated protein
MPVTTYYSANSVLLGESDSSGNRLDYLTDALGSVVGTVTSTAGTAAQLGNRYRYKPYGTQYVKTGSAPDPAFTWVGSYGYRQTARQFSDVYVRARHYSTGLGRWATQDRLRYVDGLNGFRYALANPVLAVDPTGNAVMDVTHREAILSGSCTQMPATIKQVPYFDLRPTEFLVGSFIQKLTFTYSITTCRRPETTVQYRNLPSGSVWYEAREGITDFHVTHLDDTRQVSIIAGTKGTTTLSYDSGVVSGYTVTRRVWKKTPAEEYAISGPNLIIDRLPRGAASWRPAFHGHITIRWDCCCPAPWVRGDAQIQPLWANV